MSRRKGERFSLKKKPIISTPSFINKLPIINNSTNWPKIKYSNNLKILLRIKKLDKKIDPILKIILKKIHLIICLKNHLKMISRISIFIISIINLLIILWLIHRNKQGSNLMTLSTMLIKNKKIIARNIVNNISKKIINSSKI